MAGAQADGSFAHFGGDYYHEAEVRRGVTMQSYSHEPEAFGGAFAGEFYHEPEVRRGVTMQNYPCEPDAFGAFAGEFYQEDACRPDCGVLASQSTGKCMLVAYEAQQFSGVAEPREVPFGGLAATAVMIGHGIPASQVANAFVRYLSTEVRASNVKVKCDKFSIKADLLQDNGFVCTLKAGVFRCGDGGLVVEVRRYRGDVVAFAQIFRHASRYLCVDLSLPQAPLPEIADPQLTPMCVDPAGASELQPVLDMLANTADPSLQAEAAVALMAAAAVSVASATSICAVMMGLAEMSSILGCVIASPRLDVAHPSARLLSLVAGHGLASEGPLWPALHGCLAAEGTDAHVRFQLAAAADGIARQHAAEQAVPVYPLF